ncbi:MAG TPA: alkaline phosphatase family protein [Tepidisphaeraceae bacterium]|nr:alkaline phosphatase family protein [Tepidisphaeraceae bacterium]
MTRSKNRCARFADRIRTAAVESLEGRTLFDSKIGDVFYIALENHNFTQPATDTTAPQQLLGNPAAPFLNSLVTPGNPNAAQTSYASAYHNVLATPSGNNPSIHPSEPNYVWEEAGLTGPLNDADPYANTPNNIVNSPNLSGLLQSAGISWKSYQEDIDLLPTTGTVNFPGANSLTSTVAPQNQWTVPTSSLSGASSSYANPYNGSHQYNFAVKHDGSLFFTDTNGGTQTAPNTSPSNPETQYYAPLQQLATDLTNNTVARYNWITPDQFNDMHSSLNTNFTYNGVTYTHNTDQEAVALGDNFLSIIVPQIMASQGYKNNGVIVIWNDETEGSNQNDFSHTSTEIVISPLAKGNAYDSTVDFTHSSDIRTLQEVFGVQAPGGGFLGDANTPGTNDLSDMFVPGVFTPSSLGGTVSKNSGNDHQVVAGLTIVLTGMNDAGQSITLTTTTADDGSYSFDGLLPDTYDVSVQGAKKEIGITGITLGVGQTLKHGDFSLVGPNSHK